MPSLLASKACMHVRGGANAGVDDLLRKVGLGAFNLISQHQGMHMHTRIPGCYDIM